MENGYNGWSNRATWNVSLWLDNDEDNYNLYRTTNFQSIRDFENFCHEVFGSETPDGDRLEDADLSEVYNALIVEA